MKCDFCGEKNDEKETWEDVVMAPIKRNPITFMIVIGIMVGTDILLAGGGLATINKVGIGMLLNSLQAGLAYFATFIIE